MPEHDPPSSMYWPLVSTGLGLALLGGAAHASAQTPGQEPQSPVKPTLESPSADPKPTHFARKIGLAYTPPPGARADERRNSRGQDLLFIVDGNDPPTWTITFQVIPSQQIGETTTSRIDGFLAGLAANESPPTILSRDSMGVRVLGGEPEDAFPAELVYLETPLEDGSNGVSGLLVVQTARDTFLYGTAFTVTDEFKKGSRQVLADLFSSLRIQPSALKQLSEVDRIARGAEILSSFTPDVIRAVAEDDTAQFYRIYEQTAEGEQREIGWQRLSTELAPMSKVANDLDTEDKSTGEEGLLITVKGEIVQFFLENQVTVDIVSTYWLALDRSSERWSSIRTPRRIVQIGDKRSETEVGTPTAETGVRTRPQPRSTITIVDSSGLYDNLDVPLAPEPYLSTTELFVLGRLLHHAGANAFEADWYILDRSSTRGIGIRKRSDSFNPLEDGSGWSLQTLSPSGPIEQQFSNSGIRVEKITPFGSNVDRTIIMEIIDPESLIELYREKNLPIR